MTAAEFIRKWSDSTLRERQGSQEHFIDLCRLLGEPTPAEDDPTGERYCFERGAEKVGGGDGWADVWRKGCFGWEYKGKHKDLNAALRQLQAYALDLQNPPYLVVSDMARIIVHTNWTNTVSRRIELSLDDLHEPANVDLLREVFRGGERLKPRLTPQDLTKTAAERFGELGRRLQERKTADGAPLHDPRAIAHFLNQLVFCMFAEDAKLLPQELFTRTLKATRTRPAAAQAQLRELFRKMATEAEEDRFFGPDLIAWFNGGLFDGAEPLFLEAHDLALVARTAEEHDWSQIDPAIFGTLFEQALKATRERPALGAHYTDREKILKIVEPVIIRPLLAEWKGVRSEIVAAMGEAQAAEARRKAVFEQAAEALKSGDAKSGEAARRKAVTAAERERVTAVGRATELLDRFQARLAAFRVLDPACGSGNFLYVALHALKDIELRALVETERLTGVQSPPPRVGLDCVRGIEIDRYAAELARVTLWIGDLQWMRQNGFVAFAEPILSSLEQIENRDALLNADGTEAGWPAVDVIIGNPPFVGGKKLRENLGDAAVERLFRAYDGRVPREADLVAYWVEKAWRMVANTDPSSAPAAARAGLVTTNSIRGGANRRVLEPIVAAGVLREAWSDEPWAQEGAAVRVSMIGFGAGIQEQQLNGARVDQINTDLTAGEVDLTRAARLKENTGASFIGTQKNGEFDIPGETARLWIGAPLNPNGRSNSDVVRPSWLGTHVAKRWDDTWIIYFPAGLSEAEASLYERPFEHVVTHVQPVRTNQRRASRKKNWWLLGEPMPALRAKLDQIPRFIATPRIAKHRVFKWLPKIVVPDCQLVVIARDDDTAFGLLHSRLHELWALRMGTSLEDRFRYTPSTTFETFPFPEGLTPDIPASDYADDPRAKRIGDTAAALNQLRENWLNPADLVRREPEVVPGYPDRLLPVDDAAAKLLKTRTLTNLYNERPAWLANAHRALDEAVAAAYGWPADLTDDEILAHLFALNQERSAAGL